MRMLALCRYDLCDDLEVIDVPGDHFSLLRQVGGWMSSLWWLELCCKVCCICHKCSVGGIPALPAAPAQLQVLRYAAQDDRDMVFIVTALKMKLAPFGWTEHVRREQKQFTISRVSGVQSATRETSRAGLFPTRCPKPSP